MPDATNCALLKQMSCDTPVALSWLPLKRMYTKPVELNPEQIEFGVL
jgi:hypothetical protein